MYDVTWYIVDNNEGGWCPPSDNSGKICVTVRRWTTDLQHAQPTYDDLEDFMWFLDKYVSHAVGNHYFMQWSKSNRPKTFLNKVTASNVAYMILVYEISNEVWKEELQIRAISRTDDEKCTATREKKQVSWRKGETSEEIRGWLDRSWTGVLSTNCLGFFKTSSWVMYGIHYKIIGKCIRRNSTTKGMIFKMMKNDMFKNIWLIFHHTKKKRAKYGWAQLENYQIQQCDIWT